MLPAPIPIDEAVRLRSLYDLMLLDTPPEERFDRVVRFAAEQLDMPVAMVSLIDGHRQWVKSHVGVDLTETRRDLSFCGHAIMTPGLFVIEDATLDPRFADNPVVLGGPQVRFYAGAPLSAPDGQRIGTLCIMDTVPRKFGSLELSILDALRGLVNESLAGHGDEE